MFDPTARPGSFKSKTRCGPNVPSCGKVSRLRKFCDYRDETCMDEWHAQLDGEKDFKQKQFAVAEYVLFSCWLLNEKRPQPLKTGAAISMRQVRGAPMTGASIKRA